MKKSLISVIIPVYNVEKYLTECIDSVCRQTYENLEIILVDDGSEDESGIICDKYAEKDCRIQVIHRENGGLSAARNSGLLRATGDYIVFVDSDDFINIKMIEKLYDCILKYQCDVAVCSYEVIGDTKRAKRKNNFSPSVVCVRDRDEVYECLGTANIYRWYEPQVWNKLYKAAVIKNIRFIEGKFCEDQFYCHLSYEKANKIIFTSERLYYYRHRAGSISASFTPKMLDAIEGMEQRILFAKTKGLKTLEDNTCAAMLDLLMKYWCLNNQNDERKMKYELRKKFQYFYHKYYIKQRKYSKLKVLKYQLFYINPALCEKILTFLKKRKETIKC